MATFRTTIATKMKTKSAKIVMPAAVRLLDLDLVPDLELQNPIIFDAENDIATETLADHAHILDLLLASHRLTLI